MKHIFKQLEGLVINSKTDSFGRAVLRLTALYTLGIFFVLGIFNVLLYTLFSDSIEDTVHEKQEGEINITELRDDPLIHEISENLVDVLLLVDAILLVASMIVSFLLARKTLEPLRIASQRQQRFVADAAHELRTPLSVLKAGTELLLQQERGITAYKDFAQESLEEINRLIDLANDLLFLAQNGGKRERIMHSFSLSEVCETQCTHIGLYATKKDITVHTNIGKDITMDGNSNDLSRLVLNVLKNAVDYNSKGGSVTCVLTKDEQGILLKVVDTGNGISQEHIPYIFNRFYKVDTSRGQTPSSGSGLGLSIVEEIVRQHKGSITVQSVVGKGTTFEFRFPCV